MAEPVRKKRKGGSHGMTCYVVFVSEYAGGDGEGPPPTKVHKVFDSEERAYFCAYQRTCASLHDEEIHVDLKKPKCGTWKAAFIWLDGQVEAMDSGYGSMAGVKYYTVFKCTVETDPFDLPSPGQHIDLLQRDFDIFK